jgi:Na+/H+ antiporter NhaC
MTNNIFLLSQYGRQLIAFISIGLSISHQRASEKKPVQADSIVSSLWLRRGEGKGWGGEKIYESCFASRKSIIAPSLVMSLSGFFYYKWRKKRWI